MSRSDLIKLVLVLCVVILAGSCGGSANLAQIGRTGLYTDAVGVNPTTQFGWLDPIYLIIDFSQAHEDAVLRVSWIAMETTRLAPETVLKIDEKTITADQVLFELTNQGNTWPTGDYQVNIYQNGKLIEDLHFEVLRSEDLY